MLKPSHAGKARTKHTTRNEIDINVTTCIYKCNNKHKNIGRELYRQKTRSRATERGT